MRKIFILLTFLFLTYFVKAQTTYPITQNLGSPVTLVKVPVNGGLQAVLVPTPFTDTAAANAVPYVKNTAGAIIRTTNDNRLWRRNEAKTQWLEGSGSIDITSFEFLTDSSLVICFSTGSCDTISLDNNNVFATQNYVDSSISIVNTGTCYGTLPNGNIVTWSGSGLKFYITGGDFFIGCRRYTGLPDSVTLNAADPSDPRFDVIYRDTLGAVGVVEGTPAGSPSIPQVNPSYQLALTAILVLAGDTIPANVYDCHDVYDENLQVAGGEWNSLATNISTDPDQTPIASHLTHSVFFDNIEAGGVAFYVSEDVPVPVDAVIRFKILFTTFGNTIANTTPIITVGAVKNNFDFPYHPLTYSTYIQHGQNGFDSTNKTTWQPLSVPISQLKFNGFGSSPDSVGLISIGAFADTSGGNPGATWYIDEVKIQCGLNQGGVPTGNFLTDVFNTPGALTDTLWKVRGGDTSLVQITDRNCGVFSPGLVTQDSLLEFSISPSVYRLCCDGVRRTSVQTQVTLSAADPTNPRFDGIFLDSTGVVVVEGTASANPEFPQPTDCQLVLTYIYIPAGATEPGDGGNGCGLPAKETIYDETGGSEWTPATFGVTIDFSSTTAPYHLTKAGSAGAFSSSQSFTFTKGSTITLSNYTALRFFLRLNSTFNPNTRFGIFFQNSTTFQSSRSTIMQNGSFNFVRTTVGSYMEITIPISEFLGGATTVVDRLYFLFLNTGNADGFYIDWIQLQEGICQPPTSGGGTLTSVSASNLSPLFTTVVNNPTTTPQIVFSQISQNQNLVFASPDGGSGVPTFRALVTADLPAGTTSTGANPTASVGLTAVNGVATTFLRSDGAPPLDQAIVPTWTGIHTFNNNLLMLDGRLEYDKGADVAAANDLTLGTDGNLFTITGNTQINAITTANWQAGSQIAFIFTGTPTLKNNTAGGAGTAPMLLAGRVDYTAAAGDYIGLQYDGTNWYETNRKLAATGGVYTFSNALTESPAGTVKLGGPLIQNTTIAATSAYQLLVTGSVSSLPVFEVTSSANGGAIRGNSASSFVAVSGINTSTGGGVSGTAVNGSGVQGVATTGIGIYGQSATGIGASFSIAHASNSSVGEVIRVSRSGTGGAAAGIGGSIDYYTLSTAALTKLSNQLISKWTDATDATRTSQFIITGVNNAVTDNLLKLGDNVTLTESTATTFATTTIATGMMGGGEIIVTVTADDATDYQSRTLRFIWTAVNKAGTTTVTISTPDEVVAASTGTLTATITAVDAGSGVLNFKADATSSLTQTTLRCSYQMSKNF